MFSYFQYTIDKPVHSGPNLMHPQELSIPGNGEITPMDHNHLNASQKELKSRETPIVWLVLESEDHDPGRFWLKFVAGFRKIKPGVGKDILSGLIDHHSHPLPASLDKLTQEWDELKAQLVFENIQFLNALPWWKAVENWLKNASNNIYWIGIQTSTQAGESAHKAPNLPEETQAAITNQDVTWLTENGEWLEVLRIYLYQKEFEEAGDILEQKAESWLQQGFDPLELLFWLREIPSVLLNARPILCWLAAKACQIINLRFLVNYYSNAVEHSLVSLSRFSRNEEQWKQIEMNDHGLTVGELLSKINQLKALN